MDATGLAIPVVIGATAWAAVTDIRTFRIPNRVTGPLLLTGIVYNACAGGWWGLADSLTGAVFGLASLVIFFAVGGMGAGDVKLLAAVGAWLGMPLTFHVFLAASLAAGVYALGLLVFQHGLADALLYFHVAWLRFTTIGRRFGIDSTIKDESARDDRRRRLIPFAAMIFVGICSAVIWSRWGLHSQ